MADTPTYGGAKAAIVARLRAAWADKTPIKAENDVLRNAALAQVEATDPDGRSVPWVSVEVQSAGSTQISFGFPGNNQFVSDGFIRAHVFVPVGWGTGKCDELADQAGEVFRNAEFYNSTPGFAVRSWAPDVVTHGESSDDGQWWLVTASIPFEYLHRG